MISLVGCDRNRKDFTRFRSGEVHDFAENGEEGGAIAVGIHDGSPLDSGGFTGEFVQGKGQDLSRIQDGL